MESATLADLRSEVRLYADEREAGYLTDASSSLDAIINLRARQIRGWVIDQVGGASYYETRTTFSLQDGTASYSLASGGCVTNAVERVGEVAIAWSSDDHERVNAVDYARFERLQEETWGQDTAKGYLLQGDTLVFAPTPSGTTSVALNYLPAYSRLTNATDTITGPEGIREAIVLATAVQVRGMQDKPTRGLVEALLELKAALTRVIRGRLMTQAPSVLNVHPEGPGRFRSHPMYRLPPP